MAPAVSTVVMVGLTFVVKLSLVYSTSGSGICSKDGEDLKCCANYRISGDECVECVGYNGLQCTSPCLPGFYGFGCRLNCSCIPCNNINGSCENRAKDFSLYERSKSGETLWLPILLGVFAIVGSLAAVLFFMNLKERRNTQDPNTHGQEQSNYVKELYLHVPRVYDQLKIDDRSPVYCDVI